jgi:multiple sugar transport system substrate-binding protein
MPNRSSTRRPAMPEAPITPEATMKSLATSFLALTALSGPALAQTEITYWLWDDNQLPAYQACAEAFQARHPDITVKISQTGWSDYWSNLTTALVSGTAPDVFTNHVSRYPEFVLNEQMVDLTPLIERDKVPTDIYQPGLIELWQKDGRQYGLPKDWDTIAIFYNEALLAEAGLTPADLADLDWNPKDGGSFERIVARLTRDANGNDGTSPDFDKTKVVQYGLLHNVPQDGAGQTEWSHLAASNGFKFVDHPWADHYYYDDPRLAETLLWLRDLGTVKGYSVPARDMDRRLGGSGLFAAGKGALAFDGSWMIGWYAQNAPELGIAPLPKGPEGRKSMFNGLADAIWTGSKNQEEAWQWVKFMGSAECQNIVGERGVVFPAIPEATERANEAYATRGIDVSAFIELAKPESTFLFPITDYASEIDGIMKAAVQDIFVGGADPAIVLEAANEQVNALLQ